MRRVQRYPDFYAGEEQDYSSRECLSILKRSRKTDRISQHERRLERRITALFIRIIAWLETQERLSLEQEQNGEG